MGGIGFVGRLGQICSDLVRFGQIRLAGIQEEVTADNADNAERRSADELRFRVARGFGGRSFVHIFFNFAGPGRLASGRTAEGCDTQSL